MRSRPAVRVTPVERVHVAPLSEETQICPWVLPLVAEGSASRLATNFVPPA